jgi:crotonobetainyl-CoA:carnitine CoA-transferase CaiB-like acyl-CoA transferase
MAAALDGMRVLDLTSGVAGPYATKLLADHGAEVVKVEAPGGDPSRHHPPFFRDKPHVEGSLRFLHLNTNKRSVVVDLDRPEGRDVVLRLAAGADVIVEDLAPGRMAALGLSYERLEQVRPGIIVTSITPWGQSGPYAAYRQSDLVAQAMTGVMLWNGSETREPLRNGPELASYQAGAVAALATMAAYYRQERTGEGDWIDVSIHETQAGSRDRVTPILTNHSYTGFEPRRGIVGTSLATGVRPCKDGFVHIIGTGGVGRLDSFLEMIGRGDLAGDPRLRVALQLVDPALVEEIEGSYLGWLMQRTKREAVAEAQARRLLAGAINTLDDLVEEPHFEQRGVWETIDHPHTGPQRYAGRPFIMSATPRPPARRAPLLDEDREAVGALTGDWSPRVERDPVEFGAQRGRLPLEGVRVLDCTVVWAGPYCTQLLAEWGAEVIRVEPRNRVQPQTRYAERPLSRDEHRRLSEQGLPVPGNLGYPDLDPGMRPWDRNSAFNSHARNKRSATCDITSEEGRELFYRLVAEADVFVENNVPETIEKAHVTYEELRAINPALIMLRMPLFGLNGPYQNYRGLGLHAEAMIGFHHLRNYVDGLTEEAGNSLAGDAFGGIQGAFAVAMALRHRLRTGEGQQIEMAQAENFLPVIGEAILERTMNGREPGPQANRHATHAPHGPFPCRPRPTQDHAWGGDEWIAIDVATDAEFRGLCGVLGVPELAEDARFASAAARLEQRGALDAAIAEHTSRFEKFELFHRLQAAGVTAGPLQTAAERRACPQLNWRGFFEELENEVSGRHWYPGLIWRMARTPNALRRAPVTLGQDNEYVWKQVAGLSNAEYERYVRSGQIGDTYPPEILARWPDIAAASG